MATCEKCGHPIKYYGHLLGGYRCDKFCNQRKEGRMKLGKVQREVLRCLKEHRQWISNYSGWLWDTNSGTRRTLESLKKKGAVKMEHREPYHGSGITRDVYTITPEGLKALEEQ